MNAPSTSPTSPHRAAHPPGPARRPPEIWRTLINRHPVATFLVVGHVGLWMAYSPVLFLDAPVRLFTAFGAILGLALPALLLTASIGGRPAVADLLRRTLRWRVGIRYWLLALLAIPLVALAIAPLVGVSPLDAVGGAAGAQYLQAFVLQVLLGLVTVQIFEELGWTGFAQHLLQSRYGALKAALLLAVPFATIHFPTYIRPPVTGPGLAAALGQTLAIIVFAIFFRILIAWMYNATGYSILLASIIHASFNAAAGSTFLEPLGTAPAVLMLPLAAVLLLAVAVTVFTRSSLGYHRHAVARTRPSQPSPATPAVHD